MIASNEFRTRRLHYAAYLIAASVLPLLRVESVYGRAEFVFQDDNRVGPEGERAFDHGALCPANELFTAVTYLRRQMDATKNESGENQHVASQRR